MTAPALIRVRLDTSGAKSDLQALYDAAGKGVTVPVRPGGGVPGGGGGVPGMPGGGGGGGFNVGGLLRGIGGMGPMGLIGTLLGASILGPTVQGFGKGATSVLGDLGQGLAGATGASQFAGRLTGIDNLKAQMQERFGLARGLGLLDKEGVQGIFNAMRPMAMAKGEGEAQVGVDLAFERTKEVISTLEGGFDRMVAAIEKMVGTGAR